MHKKQAKALLQLVEKAYRRGFQQGAYASKNNPDIDEDEIYKWRFNKNINKHIPAPHNKSFHGAKETYCTVLERFNIEANTEDQNQVAQYIKDILNT